MKFRSFIELHISVFLFGFTAIFGGLIQLQLISLIWWRVIMTVLILAVIIKPIKFLKQSPSIFIIRHILIGLLVSIHWIAFYGSIKISNASMVLIAMSTTSFITALVEPLIIRSSKWKKFDILISILIIPAMMMIYYNANELQQTGLWVGLLASLVGAIFSILNKIWLVKGKEMQITFIQLSTVLFILSIILLISSMFSTNYFELPVGIDWIYLIIFAVICTVLAYFLYLRSMNQLSAFDVSFAFNMEPVYGLIMAALILKDYQELSVKVYMGMVLIFVIVSTHTFLKSKNFKFLT